MSEITQAMYDGALQETLLRDEKIKTLLSEGALLKEENAQVRKDLMEAIDEHQVAFEAGFDAGACGYAKNGSCRISDSFIHNSSL